MNDYIPTVVQVEPHSDYTVTVWFDDGKTVLFDATPLLKNGVFQILNDKAIFIEKCVVLNNTLAWDISGNFDSTACLDVDPISIYEGLKTA